MAYNNRRFDQPMPTRNRGDPDSFLPFSLCGDPVSAGPRLLHHSHIQTGNGPDGEVSLCARPPARPPVPPIE